MMEENSEQTLKRTEFQLKNEDFPTLQSTFKSRRKNKKKSAKIVNKPNEIVNESSGTTSESSESMSEPSGIISEPSGIMSGPSGIVNKPSEIVNRTSGIRIPTTEISSMQVANPNVGFIPRPGSYFVGCLQPGPGMNIPIYPDGTVKNIPSTMMTDQYGMLGFLSAYRGMQVNPALATLAIGEDPINMGLGMNNQLIVPNPSGHGRREIHLNYGGPWAEKPNYSSQADAREGLEHDDISVLLCLQPGKAQLTLQSDSCPYCQHIPNEYRTNLLLGDKLAELKFPLLEEDVLFYLFYNYPGEQYQIAAAYELYIREWRYHKMRRVWLRRFDYKSVKECTTIYEKGSYSVFDPFRWRKLSVKMVLFYKDLENKPTLPPAMKKYFDP